jgi:hypothetical protein
MPRSTKHSEELIVGKSADAFEDEGVTRQTTEALATFCYAVKRPADLSTRSLTVAPLLSPISLWPSERCTGGEVRRC